MDTKWVGRSISVAFIAILLISVPAAAKRKDDVIIFKNGDRLTGEIKSLKHGQLYFKNSSMYETIRLDWTLIARVESKDRYIVELTNGVRLEGFISKPVIAEGQPEMVAITGGNAAGSEAASISRKDIVEIRPVEGSFWRQVNGSLDAGFSFSQGNSQRDFNLQTTAEYVTQRYSLQTSLDSSFSGQSEGEKTSRLDWTLGGRYYLTRKWFIPAILNFQTSSQQQLDLRTTFGSGIGAHIEANGQDRSRGLGRGGG